MVKRIILSCFVFFSVATVYAAFTEDYRNAEKWNGKEIVVLFLNGTEEERKLVESSAANWEQFGNFSFKFMNIEDSRRVPPSNIRIRFDSDLLPELVGGRSEIHIGRMKRSTQYTMLLKQLGEGLSEATITHEFGHALGLQHEHQHPLFPAQYSSALNCSGISSELCEHNILSRFDVGGYFLGTEFDIYSIMGYVGVMIEIPRDSNAGGVWSSSISFATESGLQNSLSLLDKITIAKLYPGKEIIFQGRSITLGRSSENIITQMHLEDLREAFVYTLNRTNLRESYLGDAEKFCAKKVPSCRVITDSSCQGVEIRLATSASTTDCFDYRQIESHVLQLIRDSRQ